MTINSGLNVNYHKGKVESLSRKTKWEKDLFFDSLLYSGWK